MKDEGIVQLYLERNEEAIRYTAEKYGSRLRSLSMSITSDAQTAEECENDTYLQAWNLIPPNEPYDYLYAFLARITRHISIDRCRENKSLKRSGHLIELTKEMEQWLPDSKSIEEEMDGKELGELISRFLHKVSKQKREIFIRRYFYLESIAEISKHSAMSESRVKSILFRLRNALKKYLAKEGHAI